MPFRSSTLWVAPLLAVLVAAIWGAGAIHPDHSATDDHPCAVCSAGHSPALGAEHAPAPAPRGPAADSSVPESADRPHRVVAAASRSRAPPAL